MSDVGRGREPCFRSLLTSWRCAEANITWRPNASNVEKVSNRSRENIKNQSTCGRKADQCKKKQSNSNERPWKSNKKSAGKPFPFAPPLGLPYNLPSDAASTSSSNWRIDYLLHTKSTWLKRKCGESLFRTKCLLSKCQTLRVYSFRLSSPILIGNFGDHKTISSLFLIGSDPAV